MYTNINSDWQIRILTLLPGAYGAKLVSHLSVADIILRAGVVLHERQIRVEYTALSYCWGEQTYPRLLECNGFDYSITENLFAALQRLRDPRREIHLWVDAVCINQHDDAERSRQVASMLTIFRKAATVVVWLGEHGQYTELAFRVLRVGAQLTGNNVADHSPACQRAVRHAVEGLQNIASQPWFRRVWVKQEVWAAQAVVLLCGHSQCQWESFTDLRFVDRSGGSQPWWFAFRARLGSFVRAPGGADVELRDQEHETGNVYLVDTENTRDDILNVLRRIEGCECSDPRDHVYGILGMSSIVVRKPQDDNLQAIFAVDYTKPVGVVFTDLARYVMQRDGLLNVLCLDGTFGTAPDSGIELPSWVPDWRVQTTGQPWLWFLAEHPGYINAVAPEDGDGMWHVSECQGSSKVLSLKGFIIGRIDAIALLREVLIGDCSDSITWLDEEPMHVPESAPQQAMRYRFRNLGNDNAVNAERYLRDCISAEALDDTTTGQTKARLEQSFDTIGLAYHQSKSAPSVPTQALEWKTWYRCCPAIPHLNHAHIHMAAHQWHRTQFVRAQHYLDITATTGSEPQLWPTNRVDWVVQEAARPGDEIVMVERGMLPLVLRPNDADGGYRYVGPAIPTTLVPAFAGLQAADVEKYSWLEDPEVRIQRLKEVFCRRAEGGLLHDIKLH